MNDRRSAGRAADAVADPDVASPPGRTTLTEPPGVETTPVRAPVSHGRPTLQLRGGTRGPQTDLELDTPVAGAPCDANVDRRLEVREAGARLITEYIGAIGRIEHECTTYAFAWDDFNTTLAGQDARERATVTTLLDILFVGLGGMLGGTIQHLMRQGTTDLASVAFSTASGDLAKYLTRLGPQAMLLLRAEPEPARASASAPSGDPRAWLDRIKHPLTQEVTRIGRVLDAISEALRSNTVAPSTESPAAIIAPFLADAIAMTTTAHTKQYYGLELWRPWLAHWLEDAMNDDRVEQRVTYYERMHRAIASQCGPDGVALLEVSIAAARARNAARRSPRYRLPDQPAPPRIGPSGGSVG